MGVINRTAQGFLDLVDAQTQGKSPPAFVDAVAPTVDLSQYYLAEVLGYFGSQTVHGGIGVINTQAPSENEIWRVRGLSIRAFFTSVSQAEQWGVRLSRAPRIPENDPGNDQSPFIWETGGPDNYFMTTTTANRTVGRAIWFPEPLILLPGNALLWELLQRDGGAGRATECTAILDVLRR